MALSSGSDRNYHSLKNTPLPKQTTNPKKTSDIPPQSDQKKKRLYCIKAAAFSNFAVTIVIRSSVNPTFNL